EEDTHPSLDTSLNHEEDDLEIDEPQSDILPIRRSTRTRHAPDRMCLYIDVEEHELGDLGEPANYKAALSDPESEKWLNAMNVEMQSMKDNEVWVLVELPPNGKTVGNHGGNDPGDHTFLNYNMHSMEKTVNELHAMLKLHEQTLPKNNALALHAIQAGKVQKVNKHKKPQPQMATRGQNHGKGKNKLAYAPKPKIPPPPKREDLAKDSICHECGETRHWKRNCPQYLAELMKKKKNAASGAAGLGIFVIELNTILNRSWIYDIGCGTHICNTTHGLRASRKMKPGDLSLYVGNGQREAVEAINVFYLCLLSGLEIVLNNCHYASSITRGVISVFRLYEDGFINRFVNNTIQVSRNNMVYFSAIPMDGIFEIDLSNSHTNKSSIYAVRNKRAKLDLDSALLWHCLLGHISKKHIEKLQHDGLLNSIDFRAFEKYVSCMSEKMARKPYTHQVKRAKDLLVLIHTDVCGPFKTMSRQGVNYFVPFTDDFNRYGYVYLLKHKHEVFETFKVFQKEVENQLGKTIKSLRSNHGGEYISQEFLEHLKDDGIIAHRTPPYTPQHNGVSERRNKTLLDMVRSIMSQTTLPKSFWDYALETAARILNMVPTKKRDTLNKPDKLEPRSIKCIFIGYLKETMSYSFYYPLVNKVLVARNAEFLENSLITQEASESLKDLEIIQEEDTHPSIDTSLNHEEDDLEIDEPQSDIIPIHRSIRTRRPTDHMCLYIDAEEHELGDLENSKCGSIPMQEKLRLSKSQGASTPAELKLMQNVTYALTVGYIMYDVRCTRPDVAFAQNTGYVFILNGGAIDWKSSKQSIFATSSAEVEYIVAFDASKEAVWVRKIIYELGVVTIIKEPISMYCDNTGAIAIANESGITKGARHFHAKVHYLRKVIEYGDVKLEKVDTYDTLADPFTKALAFPKHSEHTRNIRMLPISSLILGGFYELPSLQSLFLRNCMSLIEICKSIEYCDELAFVDLSYCKELKKPPRASARRRSKHYYWMAVNSEKVHLRYRIKPPKHLPWRVVSRAH
nr:hypothetical protein [Tanacetum cinerariifolium]